MANITPYIRAQYPSIEGNDRVYFDNEFRKIQECLTGVLDAFNGNLVSATIASDAVTLSDTTHFCRVLTADTEAAAASDNLATISGGKAGQILVVLAANTARTVVMKDGTGNLQLAGDHSLDNTQDTIVLLNIGGSSWYEIARSNNGA